MIALFLAIALWYGVRGGYSAFVAGRGAVVLSWVAAVPPEEIVRERDGAFFVDTGLVQQNGEPFPYQRIPVHEVHWNAILFFWALSLLPKRGWRRAWWAVLVGAGALALTHIGFFAIAVYGQVAALYNEAGMGFTSEGTVRAIGYAVQIYSVAFDKIVPFLVLVPAFVIGRKPARPPRATRPGRVPKVGRNEPCPCGSGRKFKRCCGVEA